jgi:rhomboid protease GluP
MHSLRRPGSGQSAISVALTPRATTVAGRSAVTTEPNPPEPLPENLIEVGVYASEPAGFEHGLVVLAAGRPCWLVNDARGYRLLVEPNSADEIRRQLRCFDRESVGWPPPPIRDPAIARSRDAISPLFWALAVIGIYWGEIAHPAWVRLGVLDSDAVFHHGEWWRVGTALFLHADAAHLISNGLSGIIVFSAVVATFGRWRGWLTLLVASLLGNVASAAINYSAPYRSLGASTAVFAAVGLLTGRAISLAAKSPARAHRWRAMFVPFAAGATVLALFGAGGVQIDVMAHLTGFLGGAFCGYVVYRSARLHTLSETSPTDADVG